MQVLIERTYFTLTKYASKFAFFFIIQCTVQLISPFAELKGVAPGSATGIWIELLVALLTIWNFAYLLHICMDIKSGKDEGLVELIINATYDAPAFLLYSLLYGLTVMAGSFLLVLPGLYFLIFHYFAPIASIINPEANDGDESYLGFSRRIVKPHWGKVVIFFFILLVLNGLVPTVSYMPQFADLRLTLRMSLVPIEVLLVLFGDILAIELYYYLRDFKPVSDENPL